jgi:peptide/nickel transport system ATP-binding protein
MYAGQIVETGTVEEIFNNPLHPYTRSLLNSIPSTYAEKEKLHVIQGVVPSLAKLPRMGCRFQARIPWIRPDQHEENPVLHEVKPNHWVRCTCYKHFNFQHKKGDDVTHGTA